MTTLTKTAATKELTTYARENGMTFKKVGNEYQLLNRKTKSILYTSIDLWTAYDNMQNGYFYRLAEKDGAIASVQTKMEQLTSRVKKEVNEILSDGSFSNVKNEVSYQLEYTSWGEQTVEILNKQVKKWAEGQRKCIKDLQVELSAELDGMGVIVSSIICSDAIKRVGIQEQELNNLIDELTK